MHDQHHSNRVTSPQPWHSAQRSLNHLAWPTESYSDSSACVEGSRPPAAGPGKAQSTPEPKSLLLALQILRIPHVLARRRRGLPAFLPVRFLTRSDRKTSPRELLHSGLWIPCLGLSQWLFLPWVPQHCFGLTAGHSMCCTLRDLVSSQTSKARAQTLISRSAEARVEVLTERNVQAFME